MNETTRYSGFILLLGIAFFIPFLGNVHLFDWDEINFAESSREMLLTGDFFRVMINFEPFWEKPPLYFWLQSLSMHLFGINEFAARLPNALTGIATLLVLFFIGNRHFSARFGLIWALVYFCSFLPHIYFKSGIIDPVFNLFIFLSVYYLFRALHPSQHPLRYAVFSGILSGLAVLTKGPVGFLILLLTLLVYLIIKKFRPFPKLSQILLFALAFVLTTSLWYGIEVIRNGPWFLVEFVKYQIDLFLNPVAGHEQPFYYHFVVVFIGCFPLSVFALPAFFSRYESEQLHTRSWMMILFWVVMILFTIVTTKIIHYSSMSYLPLSFLAASYLSNSSIRIPLVRNYSNWLFLVIGTIFGIGLTVLPLLAYQFRDALLNAMNDPFAAASFDNPSIEWTGYEFLIGVFFIMMVLVSSWFFFHRLMIRGLLSISAATAISLMLYMYAVVPKIEGYTQRPAIEFFESAQNKDVYVTTIGYKSYAHYFYARIQPPLETDALTRFKNDLLKQSGAESYNELSQEEKSDFNNRVNDWLLNGPIDKPVYFSTKNTFPDISGNGISPPKNAGGFKFYRRNP